ncbi:MAG: LapA family protein [Alphaproteobacteria bacterium]|nr:LapA family protein [Alphaproteobacteria bacterium]
MRYIRYVFWAFVGLVLIVVSLANRGPVSVNIVPEEFAGFLPFGNSYSLPLFLVILGAVLVGLLIGFVWEYIREFKQRSDAAKRKRELNRLEREVQGLRAKTGEGKDDVLALLD